MKDKYNHFYGEYFNYYNEYLWELRNKGYLQEVSKKDTKWQEERKKPILAPNPMTEYPKDLKE
jgi:hypothetical protein|nr:MAG TPA: hypothetical protein [Caudoviricetes sp.]